MIVGIGNHSNLTALSNKFTWP